jgi:hypothetical protein
MFAWLTLLLHHLDMVPHHLEVLKVPFQLQSALSNPADQLADPRCCASCLHLPTSHSHLPTHPPQALA